MVKKSDLKSILHNGHRLCWTNDYHLDGKRACREVFLSASAERCCYLVLHCDFLEAFVDVPDMYLAYEKFEFSDIEQALQFIDTRFGLTLDDLPGCNR
jgi:hypothetical protein